MQQPWWLPPQRFLLILDQFFLSSKLTHNIAMGLFAINICDNERVRDLRHEQTSGEVDPKNWRLLLWTAPVFNWVNLTNFFGLKNKSVQLSFGKKRLFYHSLYSSYGVYVLNKKKMLQREELGTAKPKNSFLGK